MTTIRQIKAVCALWADPMRTWRGTRQGFGGYLSRLAPNGVITVHVSNRYMELASAVAAVGKAEGFTAYESQDDQANNFTRIIAPMPRLLLSRATPLILATCPRGAVGASSIPSRASKRGPMTIPMCRELYYGKASHIDV